MLNKHGLSDDADQCAYCTHASLAFPSGVINQLDDLGNTQIVSRALNWLLRWFRTSSVLC